VVASICTACSIRRAKRWLMHRAVRRLKRKDELVEIRRKVLAADRAVVGAEQPTLGQAEHQVNGRQAQRRVAQVAARSGCAAGASVSTSTVA
jgi:hypothetical protein